MTNPLRHELRAAFPPVRLSAKAAFCWEPDADLCERAVEGKTWEEVDPRVISNRSDVLQFLDDDRLLTWLPMYLNLLYVVDPAYSSVPATLFGKLMRPDPATASKRQQRRFEELVARLSPAQKVVIARCLLQFLATQPGYADDALVALKRYWSAFEQ